MSDEADSVIDFRVVMSILADNFIERADLNAVLHSVTFAAVELITGVDVADVLLIEGQHHHSRAPTCELATTIDALQIAVRQGPCLTAATTAESAVFSADLNTETRSPRFTAAAIKAGAQAVMSFKIYADPPGRGQQRTRGALNMFSVTPHDFTVEERALGALLATHAASALITADRETQLQAAIKSRDAIGQAKGILMERFDIDAPSAFRLLRRLSQEHNIPLRDIARRVIDTPK